MERKHSSKLRGTCVRETGLEFTDRDFKEWLKYYLEHFTSERKDPLQFSSIVADCVPENTYRRLAPILNLDSDVPLSRSKESSKPPDESDEDHTQQIFSAIDMEYHLKSELSEDIKVNPPTFRQSVTGDPKPREKVENPYLKYLNRISKIVSEEELRQNLARKSGEITKSIIQSFLDWYKSLGGDSQDNSIDEDTLQELFQIGFDMPAAKAIATSIKQMPTVPESLAQLRNEPKHSLRAGLDKLIKEDIRAEEKPPRIIAFGKLLPKKYPSLRFVPPKNQTRQKWLDCATIPPDLDTMKTVWGGIENLRSTLAFCDWLQQHPEVPPPQYLKECGVLHINYQQLIEEDHELKGLPSSTAHCGAGRDSGASKDRLLYETLILPSHIVTLTSGTRQTDVQDRHTPRKYVRQCSKRSNLISR